MSTVLNATAPDTEPEPMPELAEPEPLPQSDEHPDTDQGVTDAASPDTEDEQSLPDTADEQEPEPEANADSAEPPAPVDPEDQGAVAKATAGPVPDLFNGLRAEAKSRSLRSLAQGAVVAVLAQVVLVVYPLAQHLQTDTAFHVDWKAEGVIVVAAAVNALLAYVQKAMGR